MKYRVEFLNNYGTWILKSWHKNESNAVIMAEVCEQSGTKTRIIREGKIIRQTKAT
jgi:hypothetical protein